MRVKPPTEEQKVVIKKLKRRRKRRQVRQQLIELEAREAEEAEKARHAPELETHCGAAFDSSTTESDSSSAVHTTRGVLLYRPLQSASSSVRLHRRVKLLLSPKLRRLGATRPRHSGQSELGTTRPSSTGSQRHRGSLRNSISLISPLSGSRHIPRRCAQPGLASCTPHTSRLAIRRRGAVTSGASPQQRRRQRARRTSSRVSNSLCADGNLDAAYACLMSRRESSTNFTVSRASSCVIYGHSKYQSHAPAVATARGPSSRRHPAQPVAPPLSKRALWHGIGTPVNAWSSTNSSSSGTLSGGARGRDSVPTLWADGAIAADLAGSGSSDLERLQVVEVDEDGHVILLGTCPYADVDATQKQLQKSAVPYGYPDTGAASPGEAPKRYRCVCRVRVKQHTRNPQRFMATATDAESSEPTGKGWGWLEWHEEVASREMSDTELDTSMLQDDLADGTLPRSTVNPRDPCAAVPPGREGSGYAGMSLADLEEVQHVYAGEEEFHYFYYYESSDAEFDSSSEEDQMARAIVRNQMPHARLERRAAAGDAGAGASPTADGEKDRERRLRAKLLRLHQRGAMRRVLVQQLRATPLNGDVVPTAAGSEGGHSANPSPGAAGAVHSGAASSNGRQRVVRKSSASHRASGVNPSRYDTYLSSSQAARVAATAMNGLSSRRVEDNIGRSGFFIGATLTPTVAQPAM